MGPQEMLDRAEVKNKWKLTPLKNFKSPCLTERMWRTALVVLITSIIYEYPLEGRNPCFALIGAVYGVGSQCGQLKPRMLKIQRFWAYILDFFI